VLNELVCQASAIRAETPNLQMRGFRLWNFSMDSVCTHPPFATSRSAWVGSLSPGFGNTMFRFMEPDRPDFRPPSTQQCAKVYDRPLQNAGDPDAFSFGP
jgi:hypothetical protein